MLGAICAGVLAATALAAITLGLSETAHARLFSESGPFERLSAAAWILLGVFLALLFRRPTPGVVAAVFLAWAAAARELDLHKILTGYSTLKPGFYEPGRFPAWQQAIGGLVVVGIAASAWVLLRRVWKSGAWRSTPRPAWFGGMAFATATLVGTKALDRTPDLLVHVAGVQPSQRAILLMSALEEGLELFVPLFFAAGAVAYAMMTSSPAPDCPEVRRL